MRVLVTGGHGKIGRLQTETLLKAGHTVRTLDRTAAPKNAPCEHIPGDICDPYTVRGAMQDMDAVIHLAAIPNDRHGASLEVLDVNVRGTWNVLFAALEAGVQQVVTFSSVNALGCVGGRRAAEYLPIDDEHPRHPNSPYQLSKHLMEESCRSFSERYGMNTFCLRPVFVANKDEYHWLKHRGQLDNHHMQGEYFGYVDSRDVVDAGMRCLTTTASGYHGLLLTAEDTILQAGTLEAAEHCYPNTTWKQDAVEYTRTNPFRSFFDCSAALNALGWRATHSWRNMDEHGEG